MRAAEWLRLRRQIPGRPTNREKVEHLLQEYYKLNQWPAFDHVVYAVDLTHYSNRGDKGYYRRHDTAHNRIRYMQKHFLPVTADPWSSVTHSMYTMNRTPTGGDKSVDGRILKELTEEILDFYPALKVPIVLEKPIEAHFDAEGRFHCEDGPAILWASGARHYFWNGVSCSRRFVEEPPTVGYINSQWNQERKRVLLERFGVDKWLKAMHAKCIAEDECGKLWQIEGFTAPRPWMQHQNREAVQYVEVVNGSPEPDGEYRKFFLRVPPHITTPKAGVAWTYGETPASYKIKART